MSTGTATVNGEPGYSYHIEVTDNRDATVYGSTMLTADPLTDGSLTYTNCEYITIPGTITVSAGSSSGTVVTLSLDAVTCTYDDDGIFSFTVCSYAILTPGASVQAGTVTLHVDGGICPTDYPHEGHCKGVGHTENNGNGYGHHKHGDECCVPLAAGVGLAWAIIPLGEPDTYIIRFADPAGTTIYTFRGLVLDGDIDIQFK